MTIDGFVAGPNGEQDWMTWMWDDKLQQYGNDIIAYGGATLASNLIKEDLIDEYHLFIKPTAKDSEKAKRAMNAMLQMKKLDIQILKDAFEGK